MLSAYQRVVRTCRGRIGDEAHPSPSICKAPERGAALGVWMAPKMLTDALLGRLVPPLIAPRTYSNEATQRAPQANSARPEQFADVDAERFGDAIKHKKRGIAPPSLDAAQIGLMNLGAVGQLFLRQLALSAQPLQIQPHSLPDIHAASGADRPASSP